LIQLKRFHLRLWHDRFPDRTIRLDCFPDRPGQKGEKRMNACKLLVAAAVISFVTLPAVAQTTTSGKEDTDSKSKSGGSHHYSGGPKTDLPHHMGPKKERTGSKSKSGGSHHYSGGPKTDLPHHMGPKKEQ
jgi:hypothetical protein